MEADKLEMQMKMKADRISKSELRWVETQDLSEGMGLFCLMALQLEVEEKQQHWRPKKDSTAKPGRAR